ncbi:hypothetical protein PV328_007154 [Microctonus aethiopoides]|uniref:Dolichyl-diphosphooligosaccharide--protein glycosyltransferase subunit KCP2 n=1 Tax=Microctonus aethiopoides TaxID=144406 RepID=A0AA39FR19_9HYME|nr:hypothetical protein PV328_007154 [Microctonus aethiopoides]
MAMTSGVSFLFSSILTVIIFSGMQMYKTWLTSSQLHTILGGYIGSVLFLLILTALGNLESTIFGKAFQIKLFPEGNIYIIFCSVNSSLFVSFYSYKTKLFIVSVFISLIISMIASGLVHRVSTTTCFLFSMVALYYINKISQETYSTPVATTTLHTKKRK